MDTLDKKSTVFSKIVRIVCIAMAMFHLYTGVFGVFQSILQRSFHILFALVIILLIYDIKGKKRQIAKLPLYDLMLIIVALVSYGYLVINADAIASRYAYVTPLSIFEITIGILGVFLLLEGARRAMGWSLPIIALVFIAYVFAGPYLPGILRHPGFSIMWTADQIFFTTEGIMGVPAGVSSTFIVMFIIFAAFLEESGAGDWFIDMALGSFGSRVGGPAKAAMVASGLMGMLSGSAVANVVTTGSFTIPLMKKVGYKDHFAAAVEAVASSGGQIMPPIMGATAFIISEFTGIPYVEIAFAAVIPALLYYISGFAMVHFEAKRIGLRGLNKDELPNIKERLKFGSQFLLPLVILVVLLAKGYSPMKAGLYSIVAITIVSFIRKQTWMTPIKILNAMERGAKSAVGVAIACSTAGVIVGILTLTGLGMRFNSLILFLSGGNLLLTLILTMLVSILLGMGLPTVAAYIIQASLTVPALTQLGVPLLSAHFFIFYFAIISAITPPVALAAYAAAGVSGSKPMKTGVTACKLGITAFIVPYVFVYFPQLVLIGEPLEIAFLSITAILGVIILASAVIGFFIDKENIFERILLFISAGCLIVYGLPTDLIGLAIVAYIFIKQKSRIKKLNVA